MSHKILKSLGIHAAFCHIGTERMPVHMRCNHRHLYFVYTIIFLSNMLKVLFPMKYYHWHLILVQIQKSNSSVYHGLHFRFFTIGNNLFEAIVYLVRHWHLPCGTSCPYVPYCSLISHIFASDNFTLSIHFCPKSSLAIIIDNKLIIYFCIMLYTSFLRNIMFYKFQHCYIAPIWHNTTTQILLNLLFLFTQGKVFLFFPLV